MTTTPVGGTTVLPQEATDALVDAYKAYDEANKVRPGDLDDPAARRKASAKRDQDRGRAAKTLANLAAAGRRAGWPVRALSEPLGITPERLRQIINEWSTNGRVAVKFPKYEKPVVAKPVVAKKTVRRSHLTAAERKRLAVLAKDAPHNTGSRPLDSPFRKASEDFSALIMELHDRGVTWGEMGQATGLTVNGLRMRAARHGYGNGAPPSVDPYRRIVIHSKPQEDENKDGNEENPGERKSA